MPDILIVSVEPCDKSTVLRVSLWQISVLFAFTFASDTEVAHRARATPAILRGRPAAFLADNCCSSHLVSASQAGQVPLQCPVYLHS